MRNRSGPILGILFLLALTACGGGASETLPDDLIRVWRNPAPGYEDRYFEIRDGWLLFGSGKFEFKLHPIETVHSKRVKTSTKYEIEYTAEDGGPVPLSLVFRPGNPPHLRIGMRPDLWIPEKFADWVKAQP